MAWRFRRSLKLGPIRLNFSKSGIGYSAGVRGFRVGTDAKGRAYTATSIPGTGIYNRQYYGASKGIAQSPAVPSPMSPGGAVPQVETRSGMGNGLRLLIAFLVGGAVFSVIGAMTSRPVAAPPAPVPVVAIAPVAPPPPVQVKRRPHGARRVPHASATKISHARATPLDPT